MQPEPMASVSAPEDAPFGLSNERGKVHNVSSPVCVPEPATESQLVIGG